MDSPLGKLSANIYNLEESLKHPELRTTNCFCSTVRIQDIIDCEYLNPLKKYEILRALMPPEEFSGAGMI